MGNGQSLFYPDNGNRYNRAQELGNDCEYFKVEFESKKAELERVLGPYQAKINKVMKAFGCDNLDDLTKLVEKTGTGEALEQWKNVKRVYDNTEMIDQVFIGAMGVVAIGGITISAIGALAGGIGFFAGLAITAEILLVLQMINMGFDAIMGALNRVKLREAINSLFESRLKIKRLLVHLDNLFLWMPMIQDIYQLFEDAGYDQEEIIKKLKDKRLDQPVVEDMEDEDFVTIAKLLHNLDKSRDSWADEDPDWEGLANTLQTMGTVTAGAAVAANPLKVRIFGPPPASPQPPPYDSSVGVSIKTAGSTGPVSPILLNPIEFYLNNPLDERSASVTLRTLDDKFILGVGDSGTLVLLQRPLQPPWTIIFSEADISKYKTLWPDKTTTTEIVMLTPTNNQYLLADGSFTKEKSHATKFTLSYKDFHRISVPTFK